LFLSLLKFNCSYDFSYFLGSRAVLCKDVLIAATLQYNSGETMTEKRKNIPGRSGSTDNTYYYYDQYPAGDNEEIKRSSSLQSIFSSVYYSSKQSWASCFLVISLLLMAFIILLTSYDFLFSSSTPSSIINEGVSGHRGASLLHQYGKSEDIIEKLKSKDNLANRNRAILGENDVGKMVDTIDQKKATDDTLVQLITERKKKINEKMISAGYEKKDEIGNQLRGFDKNDNAEAQSITKEEIESQIAAIRYMKFHDHSIMEKNQTAKAAIQKLQKSLRVYLPENYGKPPYRIRMKLSFPTSMHTEEEDDEGIIIIELGPIDLVPYSVYYFIQVAEAFKVNFIYNMICFDLLLSLLFFMLTLFSIVFCFLLLLFSSFLLLRVEHFIVVQDMFFKQWLILVNHH
jgi:hypothetical protein